MAVVPTVRPEPGTVTVTSLPTVVAVIPVPVKLILFTSEVNTTASSLTLICFCTFPCVLLINLYLFFHIHF